jgi:hypothetical protein
MLTPERMNDLFTTASDGSYEIRSFAVDDDRGDVSAFAVLRGTHTGEDA